MNKGGRIAVNDFKAQLGVRADLENFVFEGVKFNVTGYTMVLTGAGFPVLQFQQYVRTRARRESTLSGSSIRPTTELGSSEQVDLDSDAATALFSIDRYAVLDDAIVHMVWNAQEHSPAWPILLISSAAHQYQAGSPTWKRWTRQHR